MLETILNFLSLEKIDKQFIKKLPYFLFLYVILTIIASARSFSINLDVTELILFLSFLSFIIFNTYLNFILNNYIKNYMDYAEFDKFITRLSEVLDGKYTPFSEGYDRRRVFSLFSLILISGFSLLIFVVSVISIIFQFFPINNQIYYLILGLLLFFIYSDVIKLDFLDRDEESSKKYSFEVNLLERFTVSNTLEKIPHKKYVRLPLFFAMRIISPIVTLKIEAPYTAMNFVYRSEALNKIILDLRDKTEGVALQEFRKEEDRSYPLETILTNEAPVKLTTLLSEYPKQSYPFLFDSDYYKNNVSSLPDSKLKYTILKIVKKTKRVTNNQTNIESETVGYMFIRLFHGAFIKNNYSSHYPTRDIRTKEIKSEELFRVEVTRKEIYCIILVGFKDYIKGIETQIETNSQKVQSKAFGLDMVDED